MNPTRISNKDAVQLPGALRAIATRLRRAVTGPLPMAPTAWAGHQSAVLSAAGELEELPATLDLLAPAQRWIPANQPPTTDRAFVMVIGVVDDPMWRINGDDPFVDVVAYWAATGVWTHTSCSRTQGPEGTREAGDQPVQVRCWQPMLELPPAGSALWN